MTQLPGWRPFQTFLGKEIREIVRTWRIWVLPGLALFLALTGPLVARYTRELVASVAGQEMLAQALPEPTYLASYLQWTKNLGQLMLPVLIITLGGVVAGERHQGTAVLVLTKPLRRAAFILAKTVSSVLLLVLAVSAGAAVTWATTLLLFGAAPAAPLVAASATWLLAAVLVVVIMVLASALVEGPIAAAGCGMAALVALALSGLWGPAARFGPAGLLSAPDRLLNGETVWLTGPILATVGLVVGLSWLTVAVFSRREL